MLPVLLHRIGNAAQLLSGLDALLAVDPAALEARAGDLAETSGQVGEIGWLLALAASAIGGNLLLERRERDGLDPLVVCVRACLRREGRDLERAPRRLPRLAPGVGEGWELPWAVGSLLYFGGRSAGERVPLRWSIEPLREDWRIACTAKPGSDADRWIARPLERLPAGRFSRAEGEMALEFPRSWLGEAETAP